MKIAMLLAAGRGERLKPLTDTLPKPLIQVGEHSLIEHNLLKLKAAGVERVVINVCYRAKQIIDRLGDGQHYGIEIVYSYEPDKPLGTGGGILQALPLFNNQPFILLSSDIWTDFPFAQLSMNDNQHAHLVMVDNPKFHPRGDYGLLPFGLLDLQAEPKLTYANIGVINPLLFADCHKARFSLAELFEKAMLKQKISGEHYNGKWFNVGTVDELKRLQHSIQASI